MAFAVTRMELMEEEQLGWPLDKNGLPVVDEAEQALVAVKERPQALEEGLSMVVSERQLTVATQERPVAVQQIVQKELQFDSRYGWTYDKSFDPVEVANANGRGRFAVGSLLAASLRLTVAMVSLLEDASCNYTVRGAKYARNAIAGKAARKGLVRQPRRTLRAGQPSRFDNPGRKQGLRRPRKQLASSPFVERKEGKGLLEIDVESKLRVDAELKPRALLTTESEGMPKVDGTEFQPLGANAANRTPTDASENVCADRGRATGVGDEVTKAAESEAGRRYEAEAIPKKAPELAELQFAVEAKEREKSWESPVEADSREERSRGLGVLPAVGSAETNATAKAERKGARKTQSRGKRPGAGDRPANDERGLAVGEDQPRHLVVEMASRGGAEQCGGPEPHGEQVSGEGAQETATDGRDGEQREASTRRVSVDGLGARGDVAGDMAGDVAGEVIVAGERRGSLSEEPEASFSSGTAPAGPAGMQEAEKRGPEIVRCREEGGVEGGRETNAAQTVMLGERVGPSAERSAFTVWRASDLLDQQAVRPVLYKEAERFERGYREEWVRGQIVLEKEKRKLRSQLGRRVSGREGFHRFLGVS